MSTYTHTERWEGGGESRTDITPKGLSSSLVVMGSLIKPLRYHLNFFLSELVFLGHLIYWDDTENTTNYCTSLGPSTIGQFSRQVNLLSQPLAASLILIWSCSNIVAFEIVDGSALKEMIFAYVFYRAIFSKAFYFCLCLRASLPFPIPKLRHFPCFFFPTHIFLHYPHTLPNLSIHSPELQTSGFCQWTALCIQYWFLSCTPPTW